MDELVASAIACYFHTNDTGLGDLIRSRLEQTDGPRLSQEDRDKFVAWLTVGHREFRRMEGSDWDEAIQTGVISWKDIDDILQQGGIVWIAPGVFIALHRTLAPVELLGFRRRLRICIMYNRSDAPRSGGLPEEKEVTVCSSGGDIDPDVAGKVVDLLGRQQCIFIRLRGFNASENFCLEAGTLKPFLQRLSAKCLRFSSTRFTEEQCQALARCRRSLQIFSCSLADSGRSILEQVANNKGTRYLVFSGRMEVDGVAFANALRQSKRLKSLGVGTSLTNFDWSVFISALQDNRILATLHILCSETHPKLAETAWHALFKALRKHPTLHALRFTRPAEPPFLSAEERARRTRAVVDMAKHNTILRQLELPPGQVDRQTIQDVVEPLLRANVTRVRAKAIARETDQSLESSLVGFVLLHDSVRLERPSMWQIVSMFHTSIADMYQDAQEPPAVIARLKRRVDKLESEKEEFEQREKQNNEALLAQKRRVNLLKSEKLAQKRQVNFLKSEKLALTGFVSDLQAEVERLGQQRKATALGQGLGHGLTDSIANGPSSVALEGLPLVFGGLSLSDRVTDGISTNGGSNADALSAARGPANANNGQRLFDEQQQASTSLEGSFSLGTGGAQPRRGGRLPRARRRGSTQQRHGRPTVRARRPVGSTSFGTARRTVERSSNATSAEGNGPDDGASLGVAGTMPERTIL